MRRLPKQKRSQQRVERILEAVAEVFACVDYEAATTHAIAARAGMAMTIVLLRDLSKNSPASYSCAILS